MENVLLSLRYPKYDLEALDSLTGGAIAESIEQHTREKEEEFKKDLESGAYVPIEGREVSKNYFIDHCKRFSRDFEVDLDLIERDTCITADFYFDTMTMFSHLISAMIMAEEIMITPQNEDGRTVLGLRYNTHYKSPLKKTEE